jgi:hypothetical protein
MIPADQRKDSLVLTLAFFSKVRMPLLKNPANECGLWKSDPVWINRKTKNDESS